MDDASYGVGNMFYLLCKILMLYVIQASYITYALHVSEGEA